MHCSNLVVGLLVASVVLMHSYASTHSHPTEQHSDLSLLTSEISRSENTLGDVLPNHSDQATDSFENLIIVPSAYVDKSNSCREFQHAGADLPTIASLDTMSYPAFNQWREGLDTPIDLRVGLDFLTSAADRSMVDFVLVSCTYKLFAENRCSVFDDVKEPRISKGMLLFNFSPSEDSKVIYQVSVDNDSYSSGRINAVEESGESFLLQWSRDEDGTERYSRSASDGSSQSFVEYSDCSGTAKQVTYADGLLNSITDLFWEPPTSDAWQPDYDFCNFTSELPECTSSRHINTYLTTSL